MPDLQRQGDPPEKGGRWPFVMLYLFMWASMVITTINRDPIKFDYSIPVFLGLLVVIGIVALLTYRRLRGLPLFNFERPTLLGNIGWHIFILTGVMFISFLFFECIVQVMILTFGVSIFEPSCLKPSQRDVALYVWDAMARGVFKFLANYLGLSPDGCALDARSDAAWVTSLCMTSFTSLVLVWYVISLVKVYLSRLARQ